MKGDRVGELEEMTLLAVRALSPPVYAVPIQRYLESTARRMVAMGAVYAALDRLETKGFVRSTFGPATPTRGGKSKRLYAITPLGQRTLQQLRTVRERIWRAIEIKDEA
jgi:DNA-binding PadR family transcriptional regulator